MGTFSIRPSQSSPSGGSTDNQESGSVSVLDTTADISRIGPVEYEVIMLNDDFTPMDFAIRVLCVIFAMSKQRAVRVMLQVHTKGRAICGIYPHDIAETRMEKANQYARRYQYPLRCTMSPRY